MASSRRLWSVLGNIALFFTPFAVIYLILVLVTTFPQIAVGICAVAGVVWTYGSGWAAYQGRRLFPAQPDPWSEVAGMVLTGLVPSGVLIVLGTVAKDESIKEYSALLLTLAVVYALLVPVGVLGGWLGDRHPKPTGRKKRGRGQLAPIELRSALARNYRALRDWSAHHEPVVRLFQACIGAAALVVALLRYFGN